MNQTYGIIFALLSTISWALCAIVFKKLGEKLDPINLTAFKAVLSSLLLLIIVLLTNSNINISFENIHIIALSGIIGIALGDSLFFASLNKLSPFVLSTIMFSLPCVFSGLFGMFFLKEIPTLQTIIGILIIFSGLGFLIFPIKEKSAIKTKASGVIFAILSIICTTYSLTLIKPILINDSTLVITMYRMFFGGLSLLIFLLLRKKMTSWKNIFKDKLYFKKLCATIFLATIGGFYLSLLALKHCQLIITTSIMSLEPFFILLIMILFYKYKPSKKEIIGISIALIGIAVICRS